MARVEHLLAGRPIPSPSRPRIRFLVMDPSHGGRYAPFEPRRGGGPPPAGAAGVRVAAASDAPALAALAFERDGGDPARLAAAFLAEMAGERGERLLFVAERGGATVAFGRALRFDPPPDPPPRIAPAGWYLAGLIVAPAHRRLRIGAELMRRRLEWVFARADRAYSITNARNAASIALHEAMGLREVTRRFEFPGIAFEGGEGILFRADRPPE